MSIVLRIPILPLKDRQRASACRQQRVRFGRRRVTRLRSEARKALSKHGLTFADIKAMVITHAHVDHAGGAAELREKTRAPIIAHEEDLPYYRREKPMTFCPTGKVGQYFLKCMVRGVNAREKFGMKESLRKCIRPVGGE